MSDLPPPPYSESPGAGFSPTRPVGPLNPSLYTSHLAAHLSTLPERLRESQRARSTRQAASDLDVVERVLPHLEAFLADIVSLPRPPPAAELTFVPAAAVPQPWGLTGAAERRREGELVQLVRLELPEPAVVVVVDGKSGGGGSGCSGSDVKHSKTGPPATTTPVTEKTPTSAASANSSLRPERDWPSRSENLFDEWGRWGDDAAGSGDGQQAASWWWWRDEGAARRLAAYLQPAPVVRTERRAVQAAVVEEKKKRSGWGWGRSRKGGESSSTPTSPNPQSSPTVAASPILGQDERVNMTVRADEITFRKENDFGVWESMSGWGIVVVVTIKR
ncbi:hypothetical protein RB597_005943 [Gaeumannomyces tritici]